MNTSQLIYYIGIAIGIAMFAASWLIRRREISDGALARLEKPLMLGGAAITVGFAVFGFVLL